MKLATSVIVKYECVVAAIASLAAATQWYAAGWRPALFIFVWVFALINIPLVWYAAKNIVVGWYRDRRA